MAAFSGAFVMKNDSVKIGSTEYANNVRKVRFVPDQDIQTYKVLVPDGTLQDVGDPVWTLEMEGVTGLGGLAEAIRTAAAAGTNLTCTFQAKPGTGQQIVTATFVALYLPYGGEEGGFQTFEATFPIVGSPTITTSP